MYIFIMIKIQAYPVYSLAVISILLFSIYILLYFPEGLTMDIKIEYCKVQ